jgi:hypothetical protein
MQAKTLVSPAGAILAVICFCLPWARISCGPGMHRTVSGATLGGVFWLVPVLAVAVVAVAVISRRIGAPTRAWPIIILASAAALAIIALQSLRLASQTRFGVGADDVGFNLRAGSVGTVAGLLVALAGGLLLRPGRPRHPSQPRASKGG